MLKHLQGLAQRSPTDAEVGGESRFRDPLSRRKLAADEPLAQFVEDRVSEARSRYHKAATRLMVPHGST